MHAQATPAVHRAGGKLSAVPRMQHLHLIPGCCTGQGILPPLNAYIVPLQIWVMRLLDAKTLRLVQFNDDREAVAVRYAILSHTWGSDEVTFQDMSGESLRHARTKAGFSKIEKCCEQACRDGYPYVWIDTCCINKDSSAELSEAINSMYRWYYDSIECYAHLADVKLVDKTEYETFSDIYEEPHVVDVPGSNILSDVKHSRPLRQGGARWFTRGWTLQELIAPNTVTFFDCRWGRISTKADMAPAIADITSIPVDVLTSRHIVASVSVAARMSWAATRQTTRIEDSAYSLLGIFNVNMPMLYGEGDRAFNRLQEEIIKVSSDHSLLAWRTSTSDLTSGRGALFAPTIRCFEGLQHITGSSDPLSADSFDLSNKGLRVCLPVRDEGGFLLARLNCRDQTKGAYRAPSVFLKLQKHGQLRATALQSESDVICQVSRGTSLYTIRADTAREPDLPLKNLILLRESPSHVLKLGFMCDRDLSITDCRPRLDLSPRGTRSVSLRATGPRQFCQGFLQVSIGGFFELQTLYFGQFCRQVGSDSTFRLYWANESRCPRPDGYVSAVDPKDIISLPPCDGTRTVEIRRHGTWIYLHAERMLVSQHNSSAQRGTSESSTTLHTDDDDLGWMIHISMHDTVARADDSTSIGELSLPSAMRALSLKSAENLSGQRRLGDLPLRRVRAAFTTVIDMTRAGGNNTQPDEHMTAQVAKSNKPL